MTMSLMKMKEYLDDFLGGTIYSVTVGQKKAEIMVKKAGKFKPLIVSASPQLSVTIEEKWK